VNRALLYLLLALWRRRAVRFLRNLRRPTSCIGSVAVIALVGVLFYFRQHKVIGQLVRTESLIGAGLLMFFASAFKGFFQRGLVCEPADVEFLFTSPFTQRQILIYRLMPSYLFAALQSLVFLALFATHLAFPLTTVLCLALFQIACFHLATAAALFAGTLCEELHLRLRWMMLCCVVLVIALYLRLAWDFKLLPAACSSPLIHLFFYPAMNPVDLANSPAIHQWALALNTSAAPSMNVLARTFLWLAGFSALALGSLFVLMRFKVDPFEAALTTTCRAAERQRHLEQGRAAVGTHGVTARSLPLPTLALFRGVGAVIWKNCVAARRSRKEMMLAGFFILTYTGAFTALLWIYHDMQKRGGDAPLYEARGFTTGIALSLGMLAFFLQRMFPFDFRQDGQHLLTFRTLPASPFALALAEIAVPTTLCLLAQSIGLIPLIILGKFDWPTLVFVTLGFPATALALNSVWNVHYLIAAARRMSGRPGANSAVGVVMVVAMSFLVLYPAGWTTIKVANLFVDKNQALAFSIAAGVGLAVQYGVDFLIIAIMARLFQTVELFSEG
jgi:hypothetical protein